MGSHPIRVAVVGVGVANCASSVIQGVEYYRQADPAARVPGLMHVQFGAYHVSDVQFVAAFDVDAKKVGFDLAEAIWASENNTIKVADVPPSKVIVQRGATLDGLGKYYRETITESDQEPVDVTAVLRDAAVDVVVCYLPDQRQPPSSTRSAPSTPAALSSTRCRCSSPAPSSGPTNSPPPGSRSSATTSSPRLARRSPTAC